MSYKLLVAAIAVVVASLLTAGCTSQQQTTQSANTSSENPSANNGITVSVTMLKSPSQIASQSPRPGYRWVAFNTTVKNVNAPNRVITRNYFSLQDAQGQNYNMSGYSDALGAFNWSAHSQPGDTLGGVVVFEVPQNAKLSSITYFDGTTKIVTTV
ncbi:MAG: DUF4352 domain-containing protein [Halobacteriota archaeon]